MFLYLHPFHPELNLLSWLLIKRRLLERQVETNGCSSALITFVTTFNGVDCIWIVTQYLWAKVERDLQTCLDVLPEYGSHKNL